MVNYYYDCNVVFNQGFPKRQILDSSNLKEFADDNFRFDENGRKFYKRVENTCEKNEKLLVTSNFSFSHSVLKGLVLQTRNKQGLFGKGLNLLVIIIPFRIRMTIPGSLDLQYMAMSIVDQTARSVQSDLDLRCPQKL